jgi:hypothetical protein
MADRAIARPRCPRHEAGGDVVGGRKSPIDYSARGARCRNRRHEPRCAGSCARDRRRSSTQPCDGRPSANSVEGSTRPEPKRVRIVDGVASAVPVEIEPSRQPNGVFLRGKALPSLSACQNRCSRAPTHPPPTTRSRSPNPGRAESGTLYRGVSHGRYSVSEKSAANVLRTPCTADSPCNRTGAESSSRERSKHCCCSRNAPNHDGAAGSSTDSTGSRVECAPKRTIAVNGPTSERHTIHSFELQWTENTRAQSTFKSVVSCT